MPPREPELTAVPGMHREEDARPASRWWMVLAVVLGLAAVVAGVLLTRGAGEVEDRAEQLPVIEQQRDAAAEQAQSLAGRVVEACAAGDATALELQQVGACRQAAEVRADPVPSAPTAVQGERGPGPSLEQVEAAVAAYCAARDGCAGRSPTTAEVAAAVAEYLIANPPDPGRPPTAAEIANAVSAYFAANPPPRGPAGVDGGQGPRGETGATGARGPGPTQEEIRAAVAAELARNPPPPGPTCPPGSELAPVTFASGETGLGCVTGAAPTTAPTTTSPAPTVEPTAAPDPTSATGGG